MNKELRKMMAKKMASYKRPHCSGYKSTKEGAQEWFDAKIHKKKLPPMPEKIKKDSKYSKLSIKQFEDKYL